MGKLIYPVLTPEQKRQKRKAQRIGERAAKRSLLNDLEGGDIGENARLRMQRNANLHLRQETPSERAFAKILERFTQLTGFETSRQVSVAFSAEIYFILDCFIPFARIAIEIDGPDHDRTLTRQRDEWRDGHLKGKGIRVFRFKNAEVTETPDEVLIRLVKIVASKGPPRTREILRKRLSPSWQTEVGGRTSTANDATVTSP